LTKKTGNSLKDMLMRASAPVDETPPDAPEEKVGAAPASGRAARAPAAPAAATGKRVVQPGRVGFKMIGGHFPQETSAQLRMVAAEEGTTVQALLEEAIADLLTKKAARKLRR
jgi:hypothetical protein